MYKIAILGFGVVGGGVARLIDENKNEIAAFANDQVEVKYILDLRDFPDSPYGDKVVHDYSVIIGDPEISLIVEAMGGSHPAYEYTVGALRAGKSVVTSNKEVVANYGDEFLRIAEEEGVCYLFEASVGGGIPVLAPLINCAKQNKIREVRGILNGTTNYILTKMYTLGAGFDESLRDAQNKGYAEKNPDADVLGIDASRKIAILGALVTGKLLPTELIHTEGITGIRREDVQRAASIGCAIKLLGRCRIADGGVRATVAPYIIASDEPLAGVMGVYNAVELIGDPIECAMFYGPGAGAGPTASAIVGDVVQIIRAGRGAIQPAFERSPESALTMDSEVGRIYYAYEGVSAADVERIFDEPCILSDDGEVAFISPEMKEIELEGLCEKLRELGGVLKSKIRLL